ncbi:hypothetical protein ACO0LV_09025 [Pseudactinotalea sp. Z1739]|uniref:hypothetical protein n=1 Tax=Pseudactinotalea sp. Z1739 TaxID=3413028 RepID=UPI003C7E9D3A
MTLKQERAACERTFRRYGLPLLVHDHSARRDVFGRSAPVLVAVLLFEMSVAARLDWPWWLNTTAILLVLLGLFLGYAGLNVARGRPWSTLPQSVGKAELAFFVLAPALLVLLSGGQWRAGLMIAGSNLLLLGLIRLVVRYGLAATLWWGASRVGNELGSSLLRLVRFLPLLLIFSMALFYSSEVWQLFHHSPGASDVALVVFFAVLILLILRIRLRAETAQILRQAKRNTPQADRLPRLSRAQLVNVAVMVASNQLLQVVVISLGVGLFFFALGVLTVTPTLQELWRIEDGGWQYQIAFGDERLVITQTHLRVSVAMAMFTGLYYAVSVLTDSIYREDFISDIATKMTDVNTHRVRYLQILAELGEPVPGGPSPTDRVTIGT